MNIVKTRKLAMFYRQLSELLGSGISIIDALESLSTQRGTDRLQSVAACIKQDVVQGVPLGEAFGRFIHTFPSWHLNVIKYSEKAGRLAGDLDVLATYLEKEYSTQLGIMVKLAYPVLLLHIAFVLLPLANGVTCGAQGYLGGFLGLVIPVYGMGFLGWLAWRFVQNNASLKLAYDRGLINLPMVGSVLRKIVIGRFLRALRCLSSAGVPIVSAWNMASESCGNEYSRAALRNASAVIEQGDSISKALVTSGMFSSQTIGMIASAEKSGTISQTLATISSYYDKETDAAIGILAGVVPVLVYLMVAGFIAMRIISFYANYFNQLGNIR